MIQRNFLTTSLIGQLGISSINLQASERKQINDLYENCFIIAGSKKDTNTNPEVNSGAQEKNTSLLKNKLTN
jgi:hypothetical protein